MKKGTHPLEETRFTTLKAELAKRGETDENSRIYEALHETACDATDHLLKEQGIEKEDIDEEQLEDLRLAYKDGFWEPCHKTERDTLKAQAQRCLDLLRHEANGHYGSKRAAMMEAIEAERQILNPEAP